MRTKNLSWNPQPGDLIVFRGNKKLYFILEVKPTVYGYSKFTAFREGEMKSFSTLNCDLVEHAEKKTYNNIMSKEIK